MRMDEDEGGLAWICTRVDEDEGGQISVKIYKYL